ncbi:hypothetical protein TcWFU_006967 [Taenia crassiceps]|uniref:Uncharacterized protein n=1 Tax=Taenia crassiceps TaxID=6207 RepID=A0ABR4Q779_9CEST
MASNWAKNRYVSAVGSCSSLISCWTITTVANWGAHPPVSHGPANFEDGAYCSSYHAAHTGSKWTEAL